MISTVLIQEAAMRGDVSIAHFYFRRIIRLWPGLFVMSIAAVVLHWRILGTTSDVLWKGPLWSLLYVSNWVRIFEAYHFAGWAHTWSLAVEEQFYLGVGWFLLLLFRLKPHGRMALLFFIIAGVTAWRIAQTGDHFQKEQLYFGTDVRVDAMLFGVTTAFVRHRYLKCLIDHRRLIAGASSIGLIFICIASVVFRWDSKLYYQIGITALSVATAVITLDLVTHGDSVMLKVFSMRVLQWLGRMSYGIYLWHYPIFYLHERLVLSGRAEGGLINTSLSGVLSLLAAWCSYAMVEGPMLRLKEKFAPETLKLRDFFAEEICDGDKFR